MVNKEDFKYDILKSVYEGIYSSDDASLIFLFVTELSHNRQIESPMSKVLLLDKYEYTAIAGNATPFGLVAKWRYEGWPEECIICHKPLNYKEFYWMYYDFDGASIGSLAHVACMPQYPEDD